MTPSPEPQARASPGRRAADALLFGFAAWTLLCHATVFLGGSLDDGERSLAFHASLRAADRTLTEKDERKFLDKVERAATELGGKLRS